MKKQQQLKGRLIKKGLLCARFYVCLLMLPLVSQAQWAAVGSAGFSAGAVQRPTIAIDGSGTPYIVYQDAGYSDQATVMKYNGTSWVTVGSAGFSAGRADYTSIAINSSGTPYVVYQDGGNSNKATVMKYDGSSWVNVGSAGFSANNAYYTSIAIDGSGTPYVAYEDASHSDKATVMKFNGSSWVTVGSAGFSSDIVHFNSLTINSSGTPYLAYEDEGNSYKATVMKFDGSSWVTVGSAGFSAGAADYTSMALNSSGVPYITYQDGGNSYKATVMKYDGSSWVTVGSAGFSVGSAFTNAIAINSSGTPYVVYVDAGDSNKANVMKYDGSSWVQVGRAGFSTGSAYFTAIAINSSGTPYVVYSDNDYASKATVYSYTSINTSTLTLAAGTGSNIVATWKKGMGNYKLYYALTSNTNNYTVVNVKDTTYTIKNPKAGATYIAYVIDLGNSVQSNYATYNTTGGTCTATAPQSLNATVTGNSARVAWTGNASAYQVYYKKANASNWNAYYTSNTYYTIANLNPGTCYVCLVVNRCSSTSFGYSTTIDTFCTTADCSAPSTPVASYITCHGFKLDWTAVPGVYGYTVYITHTSGTTPVTYNYSTTTNSFTFSNLAKNLKYSIYVKTKCAQYQSSLMNSGVMSVTTLSTGCKDDGVDAEASVNVGQGSLTVYPNPSNGEFAINLVSTNTTDAANIYIVNTLGQMVDAFKADNSKGLINTRLNHGGLTDGIYFVKVKVGTEDYCTRIVVAH